jgi:hypothetical protein
MARIRFNRLELKIPLPVIVGVGGLLIWFATHWVNDLFSTPWLLIAALMVVSGVIDVAGV